MSKWKGRGQKDIEYFFIAHLFHGCIYNFSGSLKRSHHVPKKIFITALNLYQSLMWEMGLGKAEVRHSAVKDWTTVNYRLQQDKHNMHLSLVLVYNVTARIYGPRHISCHVRVSLPGKSMVPWHTTQVQWLMDWLVRTQLFFFSPAAFFPFFPDI